MDYRKILGIMFIILGLLFVVYPLYSSVAVSWIAGICLIAFGFAAIIDGFTAWSIITNVSAIKILLGICAILFGVLFIYEVDALSFLVAYLFYLIAFVLIFVGVLGIVSGLGIASKLSSVLILILGIVAVFCAVYSIAQPLYTAIIVGICLILEGINLLASGIGED